MATETYIDLRDSLITLFTDNFDVVSVGDRVGTGRVLPVADPYAYATTAEDQIPHINISLQTIVIENDTRHNSRRQCEFQIDIVVKGNIDDGVSMDRELDKKMDECMSQAIEIIQENQEFDHDDNYRGAANVEVSRAIKRTGAGNQQQGEFLLGVVSITCDVVYNQTIDYETKDTIDDVNINGGV